MADLGFVDTHVHFWDLQHPRLTYSWLAPDAIHPVLGNIDELKVPLFDGNSYTREIAGSNVTKAVHVQAARSAARTRSTRRAGCRSRPSGPGYPHAIVAYSNLKDPDVERELVASLRHRHGCGGFATSPTATTSSTRTSSAATRSSPRTGSSATSISSGRRCTRRATWPLAIPARR